MRKDSDISERNNSNETLSLSPKSERTSRLSNDVYRNQMKHLTEIVHSISLSIFEKVNTIPYAIRQFLKCLYESARVHFKAEELDLFRLVGDYLLKNWLLKVVFHKFNLEGFIPEFYISSIVKANLSLASHIMFTTMTHQEWELQTPDTEHKGLFTMNA